MKYLLLCIICSGALYAQNPVSISTSPPKTKKPEPKQIAPPAKPTAVLPPQVKPMAAEQAQNTEVMMIDPSARCKDLLEVFHFFQTHQSGTAFKISLKDGTELTNILSIDAMPNGTMVIIKYNTTQGLKYSIQKIENIQKLNAG